MNIGLADWYIYTHTDGRRTVLRQTPDRLLLLIDRPGERVEWRRYADIHGMVLDAVGHADTLEQAQKDILL